jgi:hypothetical protein
MREAHHCDTNEQLLDRARTLNEGFGEPMGDAEVIKCAVSAWEKTATGENWFGRGNYGSRLALADVDQLVGDPYALSLLNWLKAHNGPNSKFMIADGLSDRLGWPRRRLPEARRSLIKLGYVTVLRRPSQLHGPGLYSLTPRDTKCIS